MKKTVCFKSDQGSDLLAVCASVKVSALFLPAQYLSDSCKPDLLRFAAGN